MADFGTVGQVVGWLEKTVSEGPFPKSVYDHPGKAWILGRSQPLGICVFTFGLLFEERNFGTEHRSGLDHVTRGTVVILVVVRKGQGFVAMMPYLNVGDMPIKHVD